MDAGRHIHADRIIVAPFIITEFIIWIADKDWAFIPAIELLEWVFPHLLWLAHKQEPSFKILK
jgi:hypothetical protein